MQPVVVHKYGGSSVADVPRIHAVADRIARSRASGEGLVVVVSAMGDTTDMLLALAKEVNPNPPRRELDMLLSVGERISMALLSMALEARGIPAVSFTGSQSGIVTTEEHAQARIVEVKPQRLREALAEGKVVIVAGYQGVSRTREVTTLGRGGSDTSAVALAAALEARRCEICSDVDGVFTADPRVVPGARRLPTLAYEEMQALAEAGARVLNPQAVEFARGSGVAIHALSTFAAGEGTVVRRAEGPVGVVGIACDPEVVGLEAAGPLDEPALEAFLKGRGGRPSRLSGVGGATRWIVPAADIHDERLDERLAAFGITSVRRDLWRVSAVGRGAAEPRVAEAFSEAHRGLGTSSWGELAAPLTATQLVAASHGPALATAVHRALLEAPR